MTDEQLDALIDMIGELGREVHYMLDDCEESGPVGDSTFTVESAAVAKVSDILDRIEALPFQATPDAILGPGAMLQEALKQTLAAREAAAVAAALEGAAQMAESKSRVVTWSDEELGPGSGRSLIDPRLIATAIRALITPEQADALAAQLAAMPETVRVWAQNDESGWLVTSERMDGDTHYRDFPLINGVPEGFVPVEGV